MLPVLLPWNTLENPGKPWKTLEIIVPVAFELPFLANPPFLLVAAKLPWLLTSIHQNRTARRRHQLNCL